MVYPDSFPDDFEERILPVDAEYTAIHGYRVIKYGLNDPRSYYSTIDEHRLTGFPRTLPDENSADRYSTSLYDTIGPANNFLNMCMRSNPAAFIAEGITDPSCGPSRLDKRHHISWWIYKNARPWVFFKKVVNGNE